MNTMLLKLKTFLLFQIFFFRFLNLSLATEKELDLAYEFYDNKDYYRSISEIYRLKFYHQIENTSIDSLLVKNCYFLEDFSCLENVGKSYLKKTAAKKTPAKKTAAKKTAAKKTAAKKTAQDKTNILSLVSLAYLRQNKTTEAEIYWQAAEQEEIFQPETTDFLHPQKAFWLSLFPGAGFVYTQNYGTAITAFLLNATFTYLMLDSWQNGQAVNFTLFFFFEYNFYLGGMRGSREKAIEYNQNLIREKRDAFIFRYEKRFLP